MPGDFPTVFLLSTHLGLQERQDLEKRIPTLTRDASEAEVIVGKVSRAERALLELRHLGLVAPDGQASDSPSSRNAKKRRISEDREPAGSDDDLTDSGDENETLPGVPETVKVLSLAWLQDSLNAGVPLPAKDYVVYEGQKVAGKSRPVATSERSIVKIDDVLKRAHADTLSSLPTSQPRPSHGSWGKRHDHHQSKRPALLQQMTLDEDVNEKLPPIPEYLHTVYSCQRPSPVNPPNEDFIEQLKKIRTTRILEGDQIGVRAYSSSIATLSAYPHALTSAKGEIARSIS
jgi:DNA polymerase IV